MAKEKNTFKLPEEIGKGRNEEHIKEVIKERNKDFTLCVKIETHINLKLEKKAKEMEVPKSFLIQYLIKEFLK
jgi:hypothetical protein